MKKNKLIIKKYSFYLIAFSMFFLIFVAFTNINVDPEKIYSNNLKLFKSNFDLEKNIKKLYSTKGLLIYKEKQWNERYFYKILLRNYKDPECLIFGASSVVTISAVQNPRALSKNCNSILNLGLPGGTFEDYFALSNDIFPKDISEKKIFLSIQPFTLNFNRDHRWIFNSKGYYEFLEKIQNDQIKFNSQNKAKSEIITKSIKNLFSFDYFKRSIQILLYSNQEENLKIVKNLQAIDQSKYNIMFFDGSRKKDSYPKQNKKDVDLNNINFKIIKNRWYNNEVLDLLSKYKKYFGDNNKIIFLLTPYHPDVWKLNSEPINEAMIKVETKIHEFSKNNKIDIIGSYNPKNLGCKADEFIDAMHPSNYCLSKLEESYFNYSEQNN